MNTRKKIKQLGVSLAMAAGAGMASMPAQAVSYGVSLDPVFGAIFPSLSWSAFGLIDVEAGCLSSANGNYTATGACSGSQFTSMDVTFFKTGSPAGPEAQTFSVLAGPVTISRLVIQDNQLTQINAGFFADFGPTCGADPSCSIAGGGLYSFAMVLAGANVANSTSVNFGSIFYGTTPMSGQEMAYCAATGGSATECGVSANNAVVAISPIPEPQTYALMLAGLAAVGFVARRRRQQG